MACNYRCLISVFSSSLLFISLSNYKAIIYIVQSDGLFTFLPLLKNLNHVSPTSVNSQTIDWLGVYTAIKMVNIIKV